jgi:hypothetical protein
MGLLSPKTIKGQKHILAYITPGEAETLEDLGGQKVMTSLGIPAYPPGMGDPNYGGAESRDTGSDYGQFDRAVSRAANNPSPSAPSGNDNYQDRIQRIQLGIEPGYRSEGGLDERGDVGNYDQRSNLAKVGDWLMDNTLLGKGIELTGDVLSNIGDWSSELQQKAMTMALNSRIKSRLKDLDINNPNELANDERLSQLQNDLMGVKDGTFTQTDFTEKYGSGDLGGGDGGDGDRQLMNEFAPFASYAVSGETPIPSMVDQWFANNQAGTGLDPNYLNTYNTAKAQIANTMGMVDTSNQFGYSATPYGGLTAQNLGTNPFNIAWMQQRGLI